MPIPLLSRHSTRHPHRFSANCLSLLLAAASTLAQDPDPSAFPSLIPGTNLPLYPQEPGYSWTDAFPSVRFQDPVALATPPGETNRLFVVERTGLIQVIPDLTHPDPSVFLDLRSGLAAHYLEAGLLGLAFHPGYATNGWFFVFRTLHQPRPDGTLALYDVLARFQTDPLDPQRADPLSEVRLISQEDASLEHNGGDLHFGPDGYLYVSLGDMSPPADRHDGSKQPLQDHFFGAILRLDVDERSDNLPPNPHPDIVPAYRIPADNPWIGVTHYLGRTYDPSRVRTEIYALGFRNPWRMSFHPLTGQLWVGDVGNGAYEEINVVRPGGNYGWPYREGPGPGTYWFIAPDELVPDPPLLAYGRGGSPLQGNSVIGGVFYRGSLLPDLQNAYLFADSRSGHTWALPPGSENLPAHAEPTRQWLCTEPGLVAFGHDPRDGETLAAHYPSGRVLRLSATAEHPDHRLPPTLQETGLFSDLATLTPSPTLQPYAINATFWSDHALKSRWFALPGPQATLSTRPDGLLAFPSGTLWVKHFDLELVRGEPSSRRRLETRLLIRQESGGYGVTYRWDANGSNAFLVPDVGLDETFLIQEGSLIRTQVWHYPGRQACLRCHTEAGGFALGFQPAQLNRPRDPQANPLSQLDHFREQGILPEDFPLASSLPSLVDPADPTPPLHARARSYFDANCSSCHRPDHLRDTTVIWDARFTTPTSAMRIFDGRLAIPGSPADSILAHAVARTQPWLTMPPLGSHVLDPVGSQLVHQWIAALPRAPWYARDLPIRDVEGASTLQSHTSTLSSHVRPSILPDPKTHTLHRPLAGDGLLEARLSRLSSPHPAARAGLAAFTSFSPSEPFLASFLTTAEGPWTFNPGLPSSPDPGSEPATQPAHRIRLIREGTHLHAETQWDSHTSRTSLDFPSLPPTIALGLVVDSGPSTEPAHAWFEHLSWIQARWREPQEELSVSAPTTLPLALDIASDGTDVDHVVFSANGQPIATIPGAAAEFLWHLPPAGVHQLTAVVVTDSGTSFQVSPRTVTVNAAPSQALFAGEDSHTGGSWQNTYGSAGYSLFDRGSSLPNFSSVQPLQGAFYSWGEVDTDPAALQLPHSSWREAFAWFDTGPLELELHLPDGEPRRVALYFLDWDGENQRSQTVQILHAVTGEILDQQSVSHFSQGTYLSWDVRGNLRLRILPGDFGTTVISGIFLDPSPPPSDILTLLPPLPAPLQPAPATFHLEAVLKADAPPPAMVEMYANDERIAQFTSPPYTLTWSQVLSGHHRLVARAWDALDRLITSNPIDVQATLPPASATFLGVETVAQGHWRGRLGSRGMALAPFPPAWPPEVLFTEPPNQRQFIWQTFTHDPRAPLAPNATFRTAACWVSGEFLDFDLDLRDGLPHVLSLYFLDWESDQRKQVVQILDRTQGHVLDERPVERFFSGTYLMYWAQGAIRVRILPVAVNAALTGLFVDPATPNLALPIEFGLPHLTPNGWNIGWSGTPGSVYRMLTSPDLTSPWVPSPHLATSPSREFELLAPFTSPLEAESQFFRLEQLSFPLTPSPAEP